MPTNKPEQASGAGPEAKCCLGVAYFNRTLERNGAVPKCLGLAQVKQGDNSNEDDVRMLNEATGDFQYYCIGYSSHPKGVKPSREGQPTAMPFCEGVEIAIAEERMPAPSAAGSVAGPLMRDQLTPTAGKGAAMPLPPAAAGPSEEDRSFQARFRKNFWRNADNLFAAVRGEKLPQLPVQLRRYDSLSEARDSFTKTASLNLLKMRVMAEFISHRTLESVKPIWERLRSEEETE